MWSSNFQQRLVSWNQLRSSCTAQGWTQNLDLINRWWFQCPWTAYTLHWDDRAQWPDPWQLLEEPKLCSLARGLGILYTIAMLDLEHIPRAKLVETQQDNLVLVDGEKYILNWHQDSIVNINPGAIKNPRHQLDLVEVKQQIR